MMLILVDRLREAGREVPRNSEEFQRFLGTLKAESLDSSQP
jgi:hypothetical protein